MIIVPANKDQCLYTMPSPTYIVERKASTIEETMTTI